MSLRTLFPEMSKLIHLAWPIVVGQVGQMLFGFVDTVMIGQVGTTDLAAAAFGNSIYVLFLVFSLGISNSTSPLISVAHGRGDRIRIAQIFRNALAVNGWATAGLTVLSFLVLPFFQFMGQTTEVAEKGRLFFFLLCLSLLPAVIFQVYKHYLESLGFQKVPMLTTIFGLALNIVLNLILVFGFGPIPPLGLAGAGIATLISRICMVVVIAAFTRRAAGLAPYRIARNSNFQWPESHWTVSKDLLNLGVPSALVLLCEVSAFALSAVVVGWIGSVELAAHQVTLTLASLTFMVPLGIALAAGIRVGFEVGRDDYLAARTAGTAALITAALFMLSTSVIFAVGRDYFPVFFSKDLHVQQWVSSLLIIAALFQLFDGIQVVDIAILRALHDTRWPFVIVLIAYWIIALPGGYYLAFSRGMGPIGVWWGLFGGLAIAAVLLTSRFFILINKHSKHRIN